MKIINGIELANMPNGTVFSDIVDNNFEPNGVNGDMTINGLHIMDGHDEKYSPVGSGFFNGVLHMLNYIPCTGTYVDTNNENGNVDEEFWDTLTDTDQNDYTKDDWVVVYEKEEVEKIIENLQWALRGCRDE